MHDCVCEMNERRLPGMTIAVFAVAAAVAVLVNAAPGVATVGNAEIVGKARFTLLTDRMVRANGARTARSRTGRRSFS